MTTQITTFATRLNERMKEKGIKQNDLARIMGVSQQAVSRWCNGTTEPRLEAIPALAKALGVSPGFMAFDEISGGADLPENLITLRHYRFSASCGDELISQDITGVEGITVTQPWFDENIRPYRAGDEERYSLIDARGDSMSPTWESGDILVVDNARRTIDRDGFYVFVYDSTAYAKRVQRIGRSLLIISDNDRYSSFKIEGESLNLVTVCGQIIKSLNIKDLG